LRLTAILKLMTLIYRLNLLPFRHKLTGDKYLSKFVTTYKNWREEILNYFIERITNGFVEGINNGLRTMIRAAFGFRNFVNFKLRVWAQFGDSHVNPR
jgi:transposase